MSSSGLIGWFTAVSVLSIASRIAVRDGVDERCRLDGRVVEPVRRVDLVDGERVVASFCSTDCALAWPDVPAGATWQVAFDGRYRRVTR